MAWLKLRHFSRIVIVILALSFVGVLPTSTEAARRKSTVGDLLKNIKKKKQALPQSKKLNRRVPDRNLRRVKPPSSSSFYYDSDTDEAELEKVTDQGINQLYKLTRQFKRSKKRGELWLRLAELYVEKSRLIEYRIQNDFDEKLKAYQSGKTKRKPRLNLKRAQVFNKKAIELYEWFLRDFPKDRKVPQALFFLGYNHFEVNNVQKGKGYYERLTKEYPKSPYVDESNFALGEFHFDNERWKDALKYYIRVTRNRRARLYSFALYKASWSYYKLGDPKNALKALERVIRVGRRAKGKRDKTIGGVSRIRLATEALKDLVLFYAESGNHKQARSYFSRVAGNRATFNLLEKLAYYYADTGQKSKARYVFRDLIASRPEAPKSYDYQYQIVTMYQSSDDKQFRRELVLWINQYGPNSIWVEANKKDPDLVKKAQQLIETTLRNYILQQHQTAQNSKAPASQKAASAGYDLYLKTFTNSPRLDEMYFFYGELLYDMGKWELAARKYLWIALNSKKSKYYEKSIYNAILSLEKKLPTAQEIQKIVGDSTEPVEFDKTIIAFEKTAKVYLKEFKNAESQHEIKFRLASLYYYYNQFDKAIPLFNEIIKEKPNSKSSKVAANLLLDIFNIKKDYKGLEETAQNILAIPALANSAEGAKIRAILERSSFKQAEQIQGSGKFLESAKRFEEFAMKNPKSDLATGARFNAAVNYEKGGDMFKALSMYGAVIAAGGRSAKAKGLVKKSTKNLAILYERVGDYKKAAEHFQKYAAENPNDKAAVNFYFNAAVIWDGLRFYTLAIQNYDNYYKKTRKNDRKEVKFLIGKIWEKRGKIRTAVGWYKDYIKENPANPAGLVEAHFKVAQLSERLRRRTQAKEFYKSTISVYRALSRAGKKVSSAFAAESKFKLVYPTYEDLRRVKIPRSQKAQAAAVQKKIALIDKLTKQLADVIKYDDSFMVVASLAVIGQAYQHMAASIFNAPAPKGLNAQEKKEYKAQIENVAKPFQEKALENYTSAIEKGYTLQGYNEWLKVAMKEVNKIDNTKFPDAGEEVFFTKLPDWLGI